MANMAEKLFFNNTGEELRTDIIKSVLGTDAFDDVCYFFEDLLSEPYDLIVCMARKSYVLYKTFEPLILGEGKTDNRVTHDKMIATWISTYSTPKRTCIVDDTLLYGGAVRECIRRLNDYYMVPKNSISVRVFAVRTPIKSSPLLLADGNFRYNDDKMTDNSVEWVHNGIYFDERSIRKYSWQFVEAIHAAGVPYVAYIPAFSFPFEEASNQLFSRIPEFRNSDNNIKKYLTKQFDEWEFRDITIEQQKKHKIIAFCLFPQKIKEIKGRPNKDAETFSVFRFYINYKLRRVIFVPYTTVCSCSVTKDIRESLPDTLRVLCETREGDKEESDINFERQQTAHRLLRYSSSYMMGRSFLRNVLSIKDADDSDYNIGAKLESDGGISNKSLFDFLEDESHYNELDNAWEFIKNNKCSLSIDTRHVSDKFNLDEELKKIFKSELNTYYTKDLFGYFLACYNELLKYTVKNSAHFYGLPLDKVRIYVEEAIGDTLNDYDYYAVILKLCDFGGAVTQVTCPYINDESKQKAIGTSLLNGEQSAQSSRIFCNGLYYAMYNIQELDIPSHDVFIEIATKYARENDIGMSVEKIISLFENNFQNIIPYSMLSIDDIKKDNEASRFFLGLLYWYETYILTTDEKITTDSFKSYVREAHQQDGSCYDAAANFILM